MPYEFIIDLLLPLEVLVKPVLGNYGIYHQSNLLLFLRKQNHHSELNGIYVATSPEHHHTLIQEIPSSFHEDGSQTHKNWIFIPDYAENFRELVAKACELIRNNDKRIGQPAEGRL